MADTPPPYTPVTSPTRPIPDISILLLGSPGIGKTTFLSALPRVRDGRLQTGGIDKQRSVAPPSLQPHVPNPTTFAVSLFNRPYNVVIHRSESTLFVDPFPRKIDFAILSFSVDSRESLYNCQYYWRKQFAERYERDEALSVPVMLLGLKRDLRTDEREVIQGTANIADVGGKEVGAQSERVTQTKANNAKEQYVCVMPEEGLNAAQHMRCDRYAECSALTGELMWEALEDITRIAALTTTSKGGFSESTCTSM